MHIIPGVNYMTGQIQVKFNESLFRPLLDDLHRKSNYSFCDSALSERLIFFEWIILNQKNAEGKTRLDVIKKHWYPKSFTNEQEIFSYKNLLYRDFKKLGLMGLLATNRYKSP